MQPTPDDFGRFGASSKHFLRRLVTIGENRLELLMVELQEERERLLHAVLLALGMAAFGFLALVALTATLVVLLWNIAPVAVLLVLTSLYAAIAIWLYLRFTALLRNWKSLSATLEQFRKDRACLEKTLG